MNVSQIRVEDFKPKQESQMKEIKANNNHAKGDLSPKVTPLLENYPAESPVLWYGERTDLGFCVCVRKCFSLARVATDFLFYSKERLKSTGKNLLRCSMGSGGRLWKGKVLAPFPSMVIHGLLVTWFFRSLALFFDCFEKWCVCGCFFENVLEKDALS